MVSRADAAYKLPGGEVMPRAYAAANMRELEEILAERGPCHRNPQSHASIENLNNLLDC